MNCDAIVVLIPSNSFSLNPAMRKIFFLGFNIFKDSSYNSEEKSN